LWVGLFRTVNLLNVIRVELAFNPQMPLMEGNSFLQGFLVKVLGGDGAYGVHEGRVEFDCLSSEGEVLLSGVFSLDFAARNTGDFPDS